jgi:hypothetical protein
MDHGVGRPSRVGEQDPGGLPLQRYCVDGAREFRPRLVGDWNPRRLNDSEDAIRRRKPTGLEADVLLGQAWLPVPGHIG